MKRTGELKSRRAARRGYQRGFIVKEDYLSPAPDCYVFKCVCTTIANEGRDVATEDLPGF